MGLVNHFENSGQFIIDPMFDTFALPAFQDNYLWLLSRHGHAMVVDPGDAEVVLRALAQHGLKLDAILLTHHHADHTGGAALLARHFRCPVMGSSRENIPAVTHPVVDGMSFDLLGQPWKVLEVPGHTPGHVAYWCAAQSLLFCGDTLFSGGCGRLGEGGATQMLASLEKLAALPTATHIYCAHEYTLANLKFARLAEPDNPEIVARINVVQSMRERGEPSLPTTLAVELKTNPFLRLHIPTIQAQARRFTANDIDYVTLPEPLQTFVRLRAWKDRYGAGAAGSVLK